MELTSGVFTISLDFELYWGIRDLVTIEQYRKNLEGVRGAVQGMLDLFRDHGVHVTWATVGFLFFNDRADLVANLPDSEPTYAHEHLSPYPYIRDQDLAETAFHFGPDLIASIAGVHGQEIGSHTHSHYYCLEKGQTQDQFEADIRAAILVAKRRGFELRSLVFPRNMENPHYLPLLAELGIRCYRGNPSHWMYQPTDGILKKTWQRVLRLADAYLDVSGPSAYGFEVCGAHRPYDFPASRFLRPSSRRWPWLEALRLRRIKRAMTSAAKNNQIYHLWWHPHNFGADPEANLAFLHEILKHFEVLKTSHRMRSFNMGELCDLLEAGHVG